MIGTVLKEVRRRFDGLASETRNFTQPQYTGEVEIEFSCDATELLGALEEMEDELARLKREKAGGDAACERIVDTSLFCRRIVDEGLDDLGVAQSVLDLLHGERTTYRMVRP